MTSITLKQSCKSLISHSFFSKTDFGFRMPPNFQDPDMALVRLKRDVVFKPGFIAPICIESPMLDLQDQPLADEEDFQAYTAGWGLMFNDCDTDLKGPENFEWCKFPFEFNGRFYNACIDDAPTPSYFNPICHKYVSFRGEIIDKPVTVIYSENGEEKRTTCYPDSPEPYGWCGTCAKVFNQCHYNIDDIVSHFKDNLKLEEGDPGYCRQWHDAYHPGFNTEEESARPTLTSGWGFCNPWCPKISLGQKHFLSPEETGSGTPERLKETAIFVFTDEKCREFNNRSGGVYEMTFE